MRARKTVKAWIPLLLLVAYSYLLPLAAVGQSLKAAAQSGDLERIRSLIANGADVSRVDDIGNTVLHEASMWGHEDVVEYLIAQGANVNAENKIAQTPLHYAIYLGNYDAAEVLILNGASGYSECMPKTNGATVGLRDSLTQYGARAGRDPIISGLTHEGGTVIQIDGGSYQRYEQGGGTDEFSGVITLECVASAGGGALRISIDGLEVVQLRAKLMSSKLTGYIGEPGRSAAPMYGEGEWNYISGDIDTNAMKYSASYLDPDRNRSVVTFDSVSSSINTGTAEINVVLLGPSLDIGVNNVKVVYNLFDDFLDGEIDGPGDAVRR